MSRYRVSALSGKRVHYALHRWMFAVLLLDPVFPAANAKATAAPEKFELHAAPLCVGRLGSREFQKEARDTGWLSVMRVRIVWISSVDKAGVGDKKSFHLTDRFGDHALRLAGQKLPL
jgi:hypothetical protein